MFKKIILPVVILIFAHQEFYGMKEKGDNNIFSKINNWVNFNTTRGEPCSPRLWWLWAILDNVPFQYGNSKKIWKHGEAYYGLSNGIGFFPSFLNFEWIKIGIIDAHINVINNVLDYFKNFIQCKKQNKFDIKGFLFPPAILNLFFNIHIISIKILNCIKIKLVAPLTLLLVSGGSGPMGTKRGILSTHWYITYNWNGQISWWYALLSPRIEINISGIKNYSNLIF